MAVLVRLLNSLLMIGMPLALGVFLVRRFGHSWRLFALGAATFLISQLLHLPFNWLLLRPMLRRLGLSEPAPGPPLLFAALALGLSAGIFEETARYLVYRFWAREARSWSQALVFGAGHGGMESLALGAITLFALFRALALRSADLAARIPQSQLSLAQEQLQAYWSLPWPIVLLGAFERALAIGLHLALAAMVLQAITRQRILWLGFAILWHTLADASALYAAQAWGPYFAEALLALIVALSLLALRRLRQSRRPTDINAGPIPLASQREAILAQRPPRPSQDQLDESRYIQ